MKTRLTYHEVEVSPGSPAVIEHANGLSLNFLGGEYLGGGTSWQVKYVVAETLPDDEPRARGSSRRE